MNHIPMDIYYDKNLDWVSTQVKYFPLGNCGHKGTNSNHKTSSYCIALRANPADNWEVKVNRMTAGKKKKVAGTCLEKSNEAG